MGEPERNRPPAGFARYRIKFSPPWGSVGFWSPVPVDASSDDLNSLAESVTDIWAENFLAGQSAALALIGATVRLYRATDEIEGTYDTSADGGSGSDYLPANVATVVSWKLASVYRGGKPRTYIPGVPPSAVGSDTAWTSDYVAATASFAAAFLAAFNAQTIDDASLNLGTMAFFRSNAALAPPYFESFVSSSCQPRICTQRRRLGKL